MRSPILHPQSTGEDGRRRLEQAWAAPRRFALLTEVNNSTVGLLYIGTGLVFFLAAGVLALLMRIQLAWPDNTFLDAATYNQFFTMHGTVMMFLFAVPIVEAFAVFLLPSMLGARDMPFPRLSAFGYWCYALGGTLVFSSLFFGVAPDGGWFMYPPLTGKVHSPGINTDIWVLGLGFVEIAAVAAAVELVVGILKTRAPGMSLSKMPIFAWYLLVTAGMICVGMPPVIVADLLLELERALGMPFFDASRGGDPLLWQHLFWLFGHPEVYIIFLPAAGIVSMILPALVRAPLFAYNWVVMAAVAIGFLSFGLWVHHMYTTGLPRMSLSFFAAASTAIAIPMGVQVFAWIATLWQGRPKVTTPLLFVLGFLFIFTLGGLTGVMVATVPYDWQAHDSYFIVAHLHYVLIGGMVFPIFAGLAYWLPIVTGRMISERLGQTAFWLMFVGFNAAFLPMHVTGLRGMPRRVYTYPGDLGLNLLNLTATIFAFVFALGVLVFLAAAVMSRRNGREAGDNPWGAPSLEWVSSNNPAGMRSLPPIDSRYPVWRHPDLARRVHAGEGFLPDAPTMERESLVTAPITGEPEQIIRLPGPTWLPFLAALSVATMFAAGTLQIWWLAGIGGAAAAAFILRWWWTLDREMPRGHADAGRGLALPLYRNGDESLGWWAMTVLLISDASVTLSIAFAYLFLWTARPVAWPPDGSLAPDAGTALAIALVAVAAWLAFEIATRRIRRERLSFNLPLFAASAASAALAIWLGLRWLGALGVSPTAHSYGAAVWTLLGWSAFHLGFGALMALWCALRLQLGQIDGWRSQTVNVCLLWQRFTAAISVFSLLLLTGFPNVV